MFKQTSTRMRFVTTVFLVYTYLFRRVYTDKPRTTRILSHIVHANETDYYCIRRGAKRGGSVDVITAYIDWCRTRTIPFACIHCNQIDVDSSQTDLWCSAYSTYRFLSDANSNVGYTFRAIQNYKSTKSRSQLAGGKRHSPEKNVRA